MEVVERDFTRNGRMKVKVSPADEKRLKGHIPFYSVDTREEADALIEAAVAAGEFARTADGRLVEMTLYEEQTLDNLLLAGKRLADIHAAMTQGPS